MAERMPALLRDLTMPGPLAALARPGAGFQPQRFAPPGTAAPFAAIVRTPPAAIAPVVEIAGADSLPLPEAPTCLGAARVPAAPGGLPLPGALHMGPPPTEGPHQP